MTESFDIWRLLAGLGFFLFGIYLMEDSIRELAGKAFKKLIRRSTETRISAILSGTLSTAILQSSSAVNLMVLAFVGAGIMSLGNAIGVILGANIGTTFTAWIVAFFGFKINIESFALPFVAAGGLGLIIFNSRPRYFYVSKLLIGFGLLFHGLDYMKTSVDQITRLFDVAMLAGYGLWVFVLAGFLLTAVMQSSSATLAIILAGVYSGLIGFSSGAAMVIGANVGTTSTVVLGAIGGIPIKKRVAAGHFVFNLVTGFAVFLLLPLLVWFIESIVGWQDNSVLGIALFHTLFNLIGILLFLPFLKDLTGRLDVLFQEPVRLLTHYIQNTSPDVADVALEALRKEIMHQYAESRRYLVLLYNLPLDQKLTLSGEPALQQRISGSTDQIYWQLKELHGNIFEYHAMIDDKQLEGEDAQKPEIYLRASRNIMNATKNLKEISTDLDEFEISDRPFLNEQRLNFQKRLQELFTELDNILRRPAESPRQALDQAIARVDEHDTRCISDSSRAIKQQALTDQEATSIVMTNRLFTQSCRMFVYGMRSLLTNGR